MNRVQVGLGPNRSAQVEEKQARSLGLFACRCTTHSSTPQEQGIWIAFTKVARPMLTQHSAAGTAI